MSEQLISIMRLCCFLYVLGGSFFVSIVYAQPPVEPLANRMTACSPDRPLAFVQESVSLQVWVSSSKDEVLKYLWQVDAGKIKGEGAEVTWDLIGMSPGTYQAKVQVAGQKGSFADCRMTVVVGMPPLKLMSGGLETGRSILLPGQKEESGYGLYSYLLFGAEPDDISYQRYLHSIIEYLKFPDVKSLQKNGLKSEELNITYLLLETRLKEKYLQELKARNYDKYPEIAEWILKHYDYSRARALLHSMPSNHLTGPYIVSFLKPLGKSLLTPPYLNIDISNVPPDLVNIWVKYFLDQAAQERYWDENTAKLLTLKLRTSIGVTAEGLPEVKKALEDWVAWIDKMS